MPNTLKGIGQLNGIFQRQLGARANGKVCGVGSISHQHIRHRAAICGGVPVHPLIANDARKFDPMRRATQVLGIGHEGVAIQVLGKQLLAKCHRLFLRHVLKPRCLPNRFWRFHNEGGGVAIKLVGMGLKPTVLGFLNGKCEGIKQLARAQPYKAAMALIDVGFVGIFKTGANPRVDAITRNDQVGLVQRTYVGMGIHLCFKHQFNAQAFTSLLQNIEQALAANATKPVPS